MDAKQACLNGGSVINRVAPMWSREIESVMVNKDDPTPFHICRDRIKQIIQGLFADFDSVVSSLHKDRNDKQNFIFGVVRTDGSVVTIEYELWRLIRAREWSQSSRERPLKGDELELVLYSLAERGSYSDSGNGRSWRFLEREDVTTKYPTTKWPVYVEDHLRFLEQTGFPRVRSA